MAKLVKENLNNKYDGYLKQKNTSVSDLKKSIENTIQLFHEAIWSLEPGSKEQEYFMKMNNTLNAWYHNMQNKKLI